MCHEQPESMSHMFSRPPSITSESELEMFLEDLPMRKMPVKSLRAAHARGILTGEIKVAQRSTRSGHDLLELLLVSEAVLLLIVTLVAGVIPVGVVILVGGVEVLPLGTVDDEVGGATALEAAHV
jgi:hypothetical protein